jgi:hypothetical protein
MFFFVFMGVGLAQKRSEREVPADAWPQAS